MNIYDYIKNNNKEIKEINELDALIFARLSYIHIETIKDKLPISISNLSKIKDLKINKRDFELLNLLKNNQRFKDLEIERCEDILDKDIEEQFTGITIKINSDTIFIAFRGTNKNIIGFKEDMNMCYGMIPSQKSSKDYLNSEKVYKNIYIAGHSKGGNLAMYSGIYSDKKHQKHIKKIYNFDGPGFLKLDKKFYNIKDKIINYFPESSIVGRMMYNDNTIYAVKALKEGIEAHNVYNWIISNNRLKQGKLKKISNDFKASCDHILESIPSDRKKIIIDYIYSLMLKGEISNIKELNIKKIKLLLDNSPKLTIEEKTELTNFFKILIKAMLPKIKKPQEINLKNLSLKEHHK